MWFSDNQRKSVADGRVQFCPICQDIVLVVSLVKHPAGFLSDYEGGLDIVEVTKQASEKRTAI